MTQQVGQVSDVSDPPSRANGLSRTIVAAAALLALIALGVAGWMVWPKTQPPAQVSRFQVPLPENVNFDTWVSLSPDGRKLAFTATGEHGGLWIRDLDALEWRQLPGTEDAYGPFWSPDSKFLAFASGRQLKKIDAAGGPAQTLCEVPAGRPGNGRLEPGWSHPLQHLRNGTPLENFAGGGCCHGDNHG